MSRLGSLTENMLGESYGGIEGLAGDEGKLEA